MATLEIKTAEGKKASTAELADSVFGSAWMTVTAMT